MIGHRSVPRRPGVSLAAAALLGAALVLPASAPVAAASPADANTTCADVMPLADVEAGQIGTGWTVVKGTTPQSFKVEILGVYPDGIAPGKDMIMVEVSDLPAQSVIAAGDGIWAGMSGSPVYIGSQLVGAVAYGFSLGPSMIGGLSPAEDMAKLLYLPNPTSAAVATASTREPRTRLSAPVRRALTRLTGRSVAASGDFDRLAVPLSVSGVGAKGRQLLGERLAAAGIDARITRGASVPRPAGLSVMPQPGGNFSASISYGDVTVGGVGTTTWACGSRALAFGHPLALTGPASYGADDATSLAIVKDPTTGPFKLATITDPFGTVDQDRLSGIRAALGEAPPTYPVIAVVKDLDLNAQRTGRTDVTATDWMTYVAPQHLYADLITATDREGPGTSGLQVIIDGERANGDPWTLTVGDRLASGGDIQFRAAIELDNLLYRLAYNDAEDVRITRVQIKATVQQAVRTASVTRVRVSRNGGAFQATDSLELRGGDRLVFRAAVRERSGITRFVDVPFTVPQGARGFGYLVVAGGSSFGSACEFDPSECPGTFPRLLQTIRNEPRGDDLVVELGLSARDGSTVTTRAKVHQAVVLTGYRVLDVSVR